MKVVVMRYFTGSKVYCMWRAMCPSIFVLRFTATTGGGSCKQANTANNNTHSLPTAGERGKDPNQCTGRRKGLVSMITDASSLETY